MPVKKRKQSTIVVIDAESARAQTLRVRSSHVGKIRQYLVYLAIIIVTMAATTITLSYRNRQHEQKVEALMAEISRLNEKPGPKQDTAAVIAYIGAIESKVKKISQYLSKRGIAGFSAAAIGGKADKKPNLTVKETYTYYGEYLDKLFAGIEHTPVGFPGKSQTTSTFGYRGNPFGGDGGSEFHPGLDFKGNKGDAVRSTAAGKVVYAGWISGYGKCVRIHHANNYETLFGHLSAINVTQGQAITANQVIGKIGSTGRSTGYHLHYEVRKGNKPVNPKNFLRLN